MLSPLALSIIYFAVGVIIGIYFPLALIYLVSKIRKTRFGMQMFKQLFRSLALIIVIFFIVLIFIGMIENTIHLTKQPESVTSWGGLGVLAGFGAGIWFFIIGFLKGRGNAKSGQSS